MATTVRPGGLPYPVQYTLQPTALLTVYKSHVIKTAHGIPCDVDSLGTPSYISPSWPCSTRCLLANFVRGHHRRTSGTSQWAPAAPLTDEQERPCRPGRASPAPAKPSLMLQVIIFLGCWFLKPIPFVVFGIKTLKYWVTGPSRSIGLRGPREDPPPLSASSVGGTGAGGQCLSA